jgi:SAM-dependent methyltransferase
VAELSERGVAAVGVDLDEALIGLARSRFPNLDFQVAVAHKLPFEDRVLAGWRAGNVLHELPDPVAALIEARRVLAPGARVVAVGQDWDLIGVDSADIGLARGTGARPSRHAAGGAGGPATARPAHRPGLHAGQGGGTPW